jgi:hypothetical protein
MTRRPVGVVTRGTTAQRRLRRVDRWLAETRPGVLRTPHLLAVDLGFGAVPVTTTALCAQLRAVNPTATVIGLEIDTARVDAAARWASEHLRFERGGFELAGHRPHLVRAFNVLRQYAEADVAPSWALMSQRLAPGGLVIEGTCDESGRLGAWVTLDADGPRTLTLALDPRREPSAVAARLPKALIHRNVPGEAVHRLLSDLDDQWHRSAALAVFSLRQRMSAAIRALAEAGWPVLDGPSRWRRGELTLPWGAVRPAEVRGGSARSR